MTTYGEVLGYGSIQPRVQIFAVDELDSPPLSEIKADVVPSDGAKALPVGDKGPPGDQGEPALPMIYQGYVTSDDDLPDESILGPYDDGKVWANANTGSFWLWTVDGGWMEIPDGLGVPGPVGPAGSISVGTVEDSPPGGVAQMLPVGSPLDRKLNIVMPRGSKGPDGDVGPSGPIRSASDYSDVVAPQTGDVPEWDDSIGKFRPITRKRMVGPYTLINSDFSFASTSGSELVVANRIIPAQSFRYRFMITGLVVVNAAAAFTNPSIEIAPQSSATVSVARGHRDYGAGPRSVPILPYSGTKLNPGSTVGEMPAGVEQILTVRMVRQPFMTGSYNAVSDPGNNLQVWLIPI